VGVGNSAFDLAETDTTYGAPVLLASFVMGAVAYHWRERIPVHGQVFAAASAVLYGAWSFSGTALLGLMPMAYCMVYLGMQRFARPTFFPEGDYSYGIYLFGFPIQQTLVFLFPVLKVWWALFPVAAVATCAAAMASWHLVEQPALSLRSALIKRRESAAATPDVSKHPQSALPVNNVSTPAANLKSVDLGMLLPGVTINTGPDDFAPIEQMQLMKPKGKSWELFEGLWPESIQARAALTDRPLRWNTLSVALVRRVMCLCGGRLAFSSSHSTEPFAELSKKVRKATELSGRASELEIVRGYNP